MGDAYVGALDQGTTGTRFLVFDGEGTVLADAYETHEQHYPRSGWVEHDPGGIWANAKSVIREGVERAGINASELAGIGIANQRETTVLFERSGEAVCPAVVWQDRRTTDRVAEIPGDEAESIRERTGLEPDAYFSASKVEWLLDREDRRERAQNGELLVGTVDAWLIYRLTGEHVTDVTNAARTMLFDIHDREWDPDLLDRFGVPRRCLPEVRPSIPGEPYGHTDPDGFLGARVPVAGALGDQQAALFGQTCFRAGETKTTVGTGSFVLMNTGAEAVASDHGLLSTVAYQRAGREPRYALEGSIFVTGAAVEWLADLGVADDAEAVERLAGSVESTDDTFVVPAFQGLGAPHWDGRARGTVVGLTRGTGPAHLARATLEAIAFRTREVVDAMAEDAGVGVESLRIDGGGAENDLLCRFHADATGVRTVRPTVEETTALGAAYAAGLSVGVWPDLDSLRSRWRVDRAFDPGRSPDAVDEQFERWQAALERSRGWARE